MLPPLIHISASRASALGLNETLKSLANETVDAAPGFQIVVNRLAEILFIQMIRTFVAFDLSTGPDWLSALKDRHVGHALQLMHEAIASDWTVGTLARAVGLSRSAFAPLFRKLVGASPMEYLTNWRMCTAARLLRGSDRSLTEIAQSIGYESNAAFSSAFKRVIGVTPGNYRSQVDASQRQWREPVGRKKVEG
jgi:AraC-like DNA-binding protein